MYNLYKPFRSMRQRVSLGLNQHKDKRFGTVADAFSRSSAYWGDKPEWYVVAAQTRDSDALDRSNFQVLLKMLGGESDTVEVLRANHWACGWVKYITIDPKDHKALRQAIYAHCAVYNYPILDEGHFSELEYNEAYEWAERELKEYGDEWWKVFQDECSGGYSEDEVGRSIERSRERLEEMRDTLIS